MKTKTKEGNMKEGEIKMTKYKLTKETTETITGITLYRIEALKDFGDVSKGDKGGFIEKTENLEDDGDAWVSGNAWIYGNAWVSGNAWIYGNARVYGDACIYGKKLMGGYFYHYKSKNEVIEKVDMGNNYELLCSKPEFEEEVKENDLDLSGTEVEVIIKGEKYTAVIK